MNHIKKYNESNSGECDDIKNELILLLREINREFDLVEAEGLFPSFETLYRKYIDPTRGDDGPRPFVCKSKRPNALYAERSKRPPTVEVPPMITVEEAIEVMRGHLFRDQHPAESADTYLDEMYADLHRCLTAAATNNTNDNG